MVSLEGILIEELTLTSCPRQHTSTGDVRRLFLYEEG